MLQTFLQKIRKVIKKRTTEAVYFKFELGASFHPETGFFEREHPEWMADFHFYQVSSGDRIICNNPAFCYGIASYGTEVEGRLIYSYCYQEEENWSAYRGDFKPDCLKSGNNVILQDGWIRIAVKRADDAELTTGDLDAAVKGMALIRREQTYVEKDCFKQEIEQTIQTVNEKRVQDSLVFGLMTDSHYVINGGWEDSIENLRAVNRKAPFDAMIHLGDLTDGMIPLSVTKEYAAKVMGDLHSLEVPVYLTLGNHDSNYFHNNPEWMNEEEQSLFYLDRQKPWYYIDFEEHKLRCLFLHSFNHREKVRYGFPMEEVEWAKKVLAETPNPYSVLVFAHVPLLPEMHYWTKEIRNSSEMLKVFEEYMQQGGKILAYVHGHNHADQIYYKKKFPIVSIGCAKCEDFKDKKPEGAVAYDRKMGTLTQELWDVMIVNGKKGEIEFIRFGAGKDRKVETNFHNK